MANLLTRRTGLRLLTALLLGASTTLAYAPFGYWPVAWLTLALLLVLINPLRPMQAFFTGWSWGLGWLVAGLSWLYVSIDRFGGLPLPLTILALVALCAYLSIYTGLACFVAIRLFPSGRGRLLAFPALWLGGEWLRATMLTGFPWLRLGYSQIDGPLAGLAPLVGVYGIDLAVAALAAALAGVLLSRRNLLPILVSASLLVLAGQLLQQITWYKTTQADPLKVALVQGNIPQELKWDPEQMLPTLRHYSELTRPHLDSDLIVWPESAIPAIERQVKPFLLSYERVLQNRGTNLLTGVIDYQFDSEEYFNQIIALGQDAGPYEYDVSPRYKKHHLVPFGEFVPLEEWIRPLAPLFNLPVFSSFSTGERIQPNFEFGTLRLLPAICYEIILPDLLRDNFNDTDVLLTISNDAWFGNSIGPHQHLEMARMRALEFARPVVRATNNGITALVDANGDITQRLPQFESGVLSGQVTLVEGTTPFLRWGGVPAGIIALGLLLLGLMRQHQAPNSQRLGLLSQGD